ncbi:MAG: LuxR C-terminal-related transcriptional regulator [Actinomycetota bacterium]
MLAPTGAVVQAVEALRTGDWSTARDAFEAALLDDDAPEFHLGLGRSLWWMQDIPGALSHVEQAYAGFRSRGDRRKAASAAIWLSREYAAAHANEPASAGWEARAAGLLRDDGPCVEQGWLALSRAERERSPDQIAQAAQQALDVARAFEDPDLESEALAKVGYAEVAAGDVVVGTAKLDEAMAAATGGEVTQLETIGDVTCTAIAAFELAADWQRIERWGQVIAAWIEQHDHAPVVGFCNACCAEMFLSSGQWSEAEELLTQGLGALQASEQRARCVHPAAKLAELRLLQGRIEEAEQLLAGYEELPEAAHALAALHLARGETAVASAVIHRRLNRTGGDSVLAAPFLAQLVDIQIAAADIDGARAATERLASIADRSGLPRLQAASEFAEGKVAAARGDADALDLLSTAVTSFSEQGMALDAAIARMQLARVLEDREPEVAVADAKAALAEFERVGAPRHADEAAAFLRRHGSAGRTGPKGLELLTRRETEVLALLGQGLTNAQIAGRLFISTKTAGHHVSSILAKLHLQNRSEAAGFALRVGAEIPDGR